ncbi:BlaI/MecI/CopY family transcriptional regulator [Streptomyces sp. NPDC056796]|uniref:BlaI/MecI/CopY family transcriptional regulator n=1 Tax=unclassified Streptomyces TaxID=2593676 RepID=UPI0036D15D68
MSAQERRPGFAGLRRANGVLEAEMVALLQSAAGPLTPGEVAERLGTGLAHTTVSTTLARLHTKGVLHRTRQGRTHAYSPVTDEPGLTARQMHQVLERDPDRASVLTRFVDDLSDDDEQLLRRLLGTDE